MKYQWMLICVLFSLNTSKSSRCDVVTASISNRVGSSGGSTTTPANGQQHQKIQMYPTWPYVTSLSVDSFNLRSFGNPAWIGDVTFAAYSDENLTSLIKSQSFTNQIIGSSGSTLALTGFNSFTIGSDFWIRVDVARNNALSAGNLAGNDYAFYGLNNNNASQFIQGSTSSSGLIYAASPSLSEPGYTFFAMDITMTATVPEPGTMVMGVIASLSGGAGIWWKRRRRSIPSQGVEEKNLGD
jgi:hypothetical protein